MKGDAEVIKILNEVLTGELTAINQYFLHAAMCKDWGYAKLAAKVHEESIDEMKHAQQLVDRVLFLNGVPNLQKLDRLRIGESVLEQFESDLGLEELALERLRRGIEVCFTAKDHASRELLEGILASEEEHVDWLEAQIGIIAEIGKEPYLAEQM
ncbi:MAG: bacterioferritin [Hyphomicrobiaceae bacterium]|jgi:bacterioferritin